MPTPKGEKLRVEEILLIHPKLRNPVAHLVGASHLRCHPCPDGSARDKAQDWMVHRVRVCPDGGKNVDRPPIKGQKECGKRLFVQQQLGVGYPLRVGDAQAPLGTDGRYSSGSSLHGDAVSHRCAVFLPLTA